jgi:hypothetical protein
MGKIPECRDQRWVAIYFFRECCSRGTTRGLIFSLCYQCLTRRPATRVGQAIPAELDIAASYSPALRHRPLLPQRFRPPRELKTVVPRRHGWQRLCAARDPGTEGYRAGYRPRTDPRRSFHAILGPGFGRGFFYFVVIVSAPCSGGCANPLTISRRSYSSSGHAATSCAYVVRR